MSPRWRFLVVVAKVGVAAALIAWLWRSGTLDVAALRLLVDEPRLLAGALAVFLGGVALGGLRWRGLLRLADVELPVARALRWQLIAVFFNVVVPGSIGGDVVKSVYVAQGLPPARRPVVYLIALVDRFVGLAGLLVVAVIATLARGPVSSAPALHQLMTIVGVLALAMLVIPIVVIVLMRRAGERFERWLAGVTGGASWLAQQLARLVAAGRLVAARPSRLVTALGFAAAIHALCIVLFAALTTAITHQDVGLPTVAAIYPLGMLTIVVPVSPAGLGVGHVAFDRLFAIAGLTGGATVFNVYIVSQIVPCLLGAIPYVAARRRGQVSADAA